MSAERLGFTCIHKALYKDITKDGQPLIVPKPPHNEDRVNIKYYSVNTEAIIQNLFA
jgi:hypothetical protein